MKRNYLTLICFLFTILVVAQKTPDIFVDKKGIMRWSDTRREASFFGVNYTLPFAHAYRATGYLEVDRKAAIDRDVYHFARLGFSAYRIHVWDVEIADSLGNLIRNDHLDLLDYLIAQLEKRAIRIVITGQTNFGNGYPERNTNTEAYSYDYEKCSVHSDPGAIRSQQRYLAQLVSHVNPYNGKAYQEDPFIVGFEINNEPCHSVSPAQTKAYIDSMLKALQKAGNRKPVFYNVSHNMDHVPAYYAAKIQGTTYQWYPAGLVSGHTRESNFLPHVDHYPIPFKETPGFDNKARLVYEFDPADLTGSYMYPAMVRSFRSAGFQWITQFAYDPLDMAWANTEYQTHFLNLAYTPGKALSMKIAAEAAAQIPLNRNYPSYPNDTVFGPFRVSYRENLSELNSPQKFFYSNTTRTEPVDRNSLEAVAGVGSSPIVQYEGTGAYFIDRLADGIWRLEVMPDAIPVRDPFERTSLKKEVVTIAWKAWPMTISLLSLGEYFSVRGLNSGNTYTGKASGNRISVSPGVYLLTREGADGSRFSGGTVWQHIRLGEFVAPAPRLKTFQVIHQPQPYLVKGKEQTVQMTVAGELVPDSVLLFNNRASMWGGDLPLKMNREKGYTYEASIPEAWMQSSKVSYCVTVFSKGRKQTFPADTEGSPVDWDFTCLQYWHSAVMEAYGPVLIAEAGSAEVLVSPEWTPVQQEKVCPDFSRAPLVRYSFLPDKKEKRLYLRKEIKDIVRSVKDGTAGYQTLCVVLGSAARVDSLNIGFVNADGISFMARIAPDTPGVVKIPFADLKQAPTALLPVAYPVFMPKFFEPSGQYRFNPAEAEMIEISTLGNHAEPLTFEIGNIWIE